MTAYEKTVSLKSGEDREKPEDLTRGENNRQEGRKKRRREPLEVEEEV